MWVVLLAALSLPRQLPEERLVWTLPAEYAEEGFRAWLAPATLRFVAHVQAEGGTLVFVDGEPQERAHAYVNPPAFSPDGEHVAWSYGDPSGRRKETWRMVADGKESKKLDWAGPARIADDGDAWAWVGDGVELASDGTYDGGEYTILEGRRKRSDEFTEAPRFPPVRMPNGRYAYAARDSKGYRVMHGKEEHGPFWWLAGFAVSPDGERLVWAGAGGETRRDPLAGLGSGRGFSGRMRIRDGEQEWGDGYRAVGVPVLGGEEGVYLVFLARTEDGVVVVYDDRELPGTWDDVGTPALSADGTRVAYAANLGRGGAGRGRIPFLDPTWMDGGTVLPPGVQPGDLGGAGGGGGAEPPETTPGQGGGVCFLVVDGERVAGDWLRVTDPTWSADGSQVAIRVQSTDGWQVSAGATVSEAYDDVGPPLLSADGSQVGFAARKGRELWWKVLDIETVGKGDDDTDTDGNGETVGDGG